MAGIQVTGWMGGVEIASDRFIQWETGHQWEGKPEYAVAHYIQLPVSAATRTQTGGVTHSLDRETRSYENPVPRFQEQKEEKKLFELERKYLEVYKKKLDKELKKEVGEVVWTWSLFLPQLWGSNRMVSRLDR